MNKSLITPDTDLQRLYPRRGRRRKIKELQNVLRVPVDILAIKEWLRWTIFIGIILSLVMLFFTWRLALGGFATFNAIGWIAGRFFAKEFELTTVKQLTEKLARENYSKARRNSSRINKAEIAQKVKELFQYDLHWAGITLTRESTFD